ncbi:PQQ-binding-like beta-propeller repeat protein [Mucilaginibacter sp.]|jgi:quinoprotein glucose dehydrogenase|uniref:outer membrane protein assembly factor BamB family protein n=1 Tax=Mucilaginibacter sp. TaxID=1882438 RepID=UPI002BE74698|nr:PQQ-binding-like beta-propeller repeat protein [Mucilaginibacter sp.]HTI59846.1 PQQ-binding-like beta-propeller repeat protein [Mucilaginibacter sp.]
MTGFRSSALTVFGAVLLFCSCKNQSGDNTIWRVYGGSKMAQHYSSLTQIDSANVNQLQVAWEYHTHDADTAGHSQIQCSPIMVDGTLYGTSPKLRLFAVDAATGKEKWTFNPAGNTNSSPMSFGMNNNRGVTYWEDGDDKRILYCAGSNIYAINAANGEVVKSFGTYGKVDLHNDLGLDASKMYVTATSPGIIYKNLYIIGSRVNETADAAPGHIRAYDVRTGKLKWIFHTIPRPGEQGYNTWEDTAAYKHIGSANSWSGFSMDEKRGLLFAPTGSAAYDFYGGKRLGQGLFANCVLALDAETGKLKWHYQVIHHDIWDKDLPTAPVLVTIRKDGRDVDAVAQPTKHGFIFVLDRETGKPLFPVKETVVPTSSDLKGEKPWPTQPIPELPVPFARQTLTENDINPYLSNSSKAEVLKRLKSYRYGNMFLPPGKQPTVIFPGFDGGAEWGGPAYDPATGIMYINANEMAWVMTIADTKTRAAKNENFTQAGQRLFMSNCMSCHGKDRKGTGNFPSLINVQTKYKDSQIADLLKTGRRMMPSFKQLSPQESGAIISYVTGNNTSGKAAFIEEHKAVDPYLDIPYMMTGYNKFLSKEGLPAISPPWGTLNAINLNTGKMVWRIPFGDDPEMAAPGRVTGTENYGGPAVTAGGLLFIGATKDGMIRAFNKRNGKLLWQYKLPAAGFATPAVYEAGGKEYLVIACGGGKLGTKSGGSYVAFALPK